jgi:hypothetical protein
MKRLTEYYDGEARVIRIDHKKAFAKLAAYEDTELTPEEVGELKQELIAARSRLVDVEKALELAGECLQEELCVDCPLDIDEFDCEALGFDCDMDCWKEYFLWGKRWRNYVD